MRLSSDFIMGSLTSFDCQTGTFSQFGRELFSFRNGPFL